MVGLNLIHARRVLSQAVELREKIRLDIAAKQFVADDVHMSAYNDLIANAAALFPEDPILNGQRIKKPDAAVQTFGMLLPIERMPPELGLQRTDARLTRLINRLEFFVGSPPEDSSLIRPASQILDETRSEDVQEIRDAIRQLREQFPKEVSIDERDFAFVSEPSLRSLLRSDFVEAQRSFAASAFKGSCLLSGVVIEGILLNQLQLQDTVAQSGYEQAVARFHRVGTEIDWDRVGMTQLIEAAASLGFLGISTKLFAKGARDFRDTIHPRAELRLQMRGGQEEAELLLAFVKLVYRDIANLS